MCHNIVLLLPYVDEWLLFNSLGYFSPNIYLIKINKRNTKKKCEIYSKLTGKTPERHH